MVRTFILAVAAAGVVFTAAAVWYSVTYWRKEILCGKEHLEIGIMYIAAAVSFLAPVCVAIMCDAALGWERYMGVPGIVLHLIGVCHLVQSGKYWLRRK